MTAENELVLMADDESNESAQCWVRQGDKIIRKIDGIVLDISGRLRKDGAPILGFIDNGGINQRWRIVSTVAKKVVKCS